MLFLFLSVFLIYDSSIIFLIYSLGKVIFIFFFFVLLLRSFILFISPPPIFHSFSLFNSLSIPPTLHFFLHSRGHYPCFRCIIAFFYYYSCFPPRLKRQQNNAFFYVFIYLSWINNQKRKQLAGNKVLSERRKAK